MKKIIIMTAAICILTATLTACGNKTNSGAKETTAAATTTTTASGSETSGDASDSGDSLTEGLTDAKNALADFGDAIESVGEWPAMDEFTDKDIVKDNMGLDLENPNYKNIYVRKAMMSAAFGEYIIIEADNVDAAVADLEARRTKLIEVDAFYPEHKELAEQTVVGKIGNYAYLIASDGAKDAETALRNAIGE